MPSTRGTFLKIASVCLLVVSLFACKSEPKETFTSSGSKYIHHIKNNGITPQVGEEATFTVDVRNDTKVVQSSRDQGKPATMIVPPLDPNGRSMSPIVEAIMLMSVGDSVTVYQSTDSFPQKPPGFENTPFIFYDLVLTSIKSKEVIEEERLRKQEEMLKVQAREPEVATTTAAALASYKSKKLGDALKTTASGLKYTVLEEGTGQQVEVGKRVDVHYYGMTTDGNMFDNSFKRGETFGVPIGRGQVIKGWDEGIPLFKEGTKAVLFIPHELGYGEAGSPPSIPSKAELVFYVEVVKVN